MENLERQQKQTIERLEQEHTNRLRDEAKRIKAEQDKELSKYQNVLKNRKKEVWASLTSPLIVPAAALRRTAGLIGSLFIESCFNIHTHTHTTLICLISVYITTHQLPRGPKSVCAATAIFSRSANLSG